MNTIALIKKHEGIRTRTYADSLGIETVGVGFNLRRSGAREVVTKVGADYDKVLAGTQDLTPDQIDTLLNQDIADCVKDLHLLFPGFDAMPAPAQMVLTDMRFQLGGNGLRAFKNTLQSFRDGRWADAAAGIKASAMYKQVPVRCNENIALLLAIKV